jgi:transposase
VSERWLEAQLYPPPVAPSSQSRPEPDWPGVHRELRRKGVTLDLLWQEYKAEHPSGYHYSGFCAHYRRWVVRLSVSHAPDTHPGREAVHRLRRPDGANHRRDDRRNSPGSDLSRRAGRFELHLLRSQGMLWSQSLPDWIGSHVRTFEHLNGCTALLVPDNLKSGVTTACYYDPELNPTYRDLATHYGTAVLPARPYRPKDKAKAEAAVLLVERWVLARLRHQQFFSLDELNRVPGRADDGASIAVRSRSYRAAVSRPSLEMDRPALRPLPAHALRVCRMEGGPGRHRLSRRGRRPLLLGALPLCSPEGRQSADGDDHRTVSAAAPASPAMPGMTLAVGTLPSMRT